MNILNHYNAYTVKILNFTFLYLQGVVYSNFNKISINFTVSNNKNLSIPVTIATTDGTFYSRFVTYTYGNGWNCSYYTDGSGNKTIADDCKIYGIIPFIN